MLKILPIIPSRTYSHIITYYSYIRILVVFIVSVIIMSTIAMHTVTGEQDIL